MTSILFGTLHGSRTHNLRYRKPMLYPVGLTRHNSVITKGADIVMATG